jgi:hypothetical protein
VADVAVAARVASRRTSYDLRRARPGVAKTGFTERQARFLTTVMLHAGVCVPRQYARFCGIVHGAKTQKFFAKLVRLGYASMYDCRHNRARSTT